LRTPKLVISVMKLAAYRRWLSDKADLLHYVRSARHYAKLQHVKAAII